MSDVGASDGCTGRLRELRSRHARAAQPTVRGRGDAHPLLLSYPLTCPALSHTTQPHPPHLRQPTRWQTDLSSHTRHTSHTLHTSQRRPPSSHTGHTSHTSRRLCHTCHTCRILLITGQLSRRCYVGASSRSAPSSGSARSARLESAARGSGVIGVWSTR